MANNDIGAALLFDRGFGRSASVMAGRYRHIKADALAQSAANGAPVAVWARDGWATICDTPPDDLPVDPTRYGWTLHEIVSA